jgi:hypothetical protein
MALAWGHAEGEGMGRFGIEQEPAATQRKSRSTRQPPPNVRWDASIEELLDDWHRRAWAAQLGHYKVAAKARRQNVWLGVPVVIFSAVVGTSLFATLSQAKLPIALRITVGTISVLAAVLAAIQNFFGAAQLAEKHVLAADWYSSIRRRIEMIQALPPQARDDPTKVVDAIRKEMNTVGSQFPELSPAVWSEVCRRFGIQDRAPKGGKDGTAQPAATETAVGTGQVEVRV